MKSQDFEISLMKARELCQSEVTLESFYRELRESGLEYGPAFQGIRKIWRGSELILGQISISPEFASDIASYNIHPGLLDSCLQLMARLVPHLKTDSQTIYLPAGFEKVQWFGKAGESVWCLMKPISVSSDLVSDIWIWNESGQPVGYLKGFRLSKLDTELVKESFELSAESEEPDLFYHIQWQNYLTDLKTTEKVKSGSWLIVGTSPEDLQMIKGGLQGSDVETLCLDQDQIQFPQVFLESVFKKMERPVDHLVFFSSQSEADLFQAQKSGYSLALEILKEISNHASFSETQLHFVTAGAVSLGEEKILHSAQSPIWGLGRVAQMEMAELQPQLVDLDPDRPIQSQITVLRFVMTEANREPQIAIRNEQVFISRFARGNKNQTEDSTPTSFDGVQLITGGLGSLGLEVMSWLRQKGAKSIALVGRRPPNESALKKIEELRLSQVNVQFYQSDISDRSLVRKLFSEVEKKQGPIRGIFHAAGTLSDSLISHQTWDSFEHVFSSKAVGAWNLHQESSKFELKHFVLFSSLSSVLGNAGQANYAAANAYLDALAHERRNQGKPATSIQWGPWSGSSMVLQKNSDFKSSLEKVGIHPLDNSMAIDCLEIAVTKNSVCTAVASVDWARYAEQVLEDHENRFLSQLVPQASDNGNSEQVLKTEVQSAFREELADLNPVDRRERVVAYVRKEVASILGLSPAEVDTKKGLMQMGMDSVLAVKFRNKLKKDLNHALPATLIFNQPHVEALADYFLKEVFKFSEKKSGSQATVKAAKAATNEPIAVVGMACRFAQGVNSPEKFWNFLANSSDAITEIPKSRFELEGQSYFNLNPEVPGTTYLRKGSFIEGVDLFDPQFFGISPREATAVDPQQRLLLEVSWEAMENAGIPMQKLEGSRTGVYVGVMYNDYRDLVMHSKERAELEGHIAVGNGISALAGRISYTFGFVGPSMTVDTACSSSLVATHLACQSLRSGASDVALASGVNLILLPEGYVLMSRSKAFSLHKGKCSPFDESADGYVRGEGCGVLVLKRLSDAQAQGDKILAVIRGSAVNHGGHSTTITAPNGKAQESLIRDALANAGVDPSEVSYIEAHGTGTPLGDPIEAQALTEVFKEQKTAEEPLFIGAVKSNIGHTESAAGVAGLIKTILALQHQQIPATLNYRKLNPEISFEKIPARVVDSLIPWNPKKGKRIAGVSSFGITGTNSHILLEEAPSETVKISDNTQEHPFLLCLSAKSKNALSAMSENYVKFLEENQNLSLAEICASAYLGRSHFEERLAVVGKNHSEVSAALKAEQTPGKFSGQYYEHNQPKVGFLFTGQGAHYLGMAKNLYFSYPIFRQTMDRCEKILAPIFGVSFLDVVFGEDGKYLEKTQYTQPSLYAIQCSLVELWKSLGIQPAWVLGHSSGEYAAAYAAGIYSLEDGLRLTAQRGYLCQNLPGDGTMASTDLSEEEALKYIAGNPAISIAAINGPEGLVLAGETPAMNLLLAKIADDGHRVKKVNVSFASHSPQMDALLTELTHAAANIEHKAPQVNYISTLLGRKVKNHEVNSNYWATHARQPVRFMEAIQNVYNDGCRIFIEIGASSTLAHMGQLSITDPKVAWLESLSPKEEECQKLMSNLAELYTRGMDLNWLGVDTLERRKKVRLPNYPFQRQSYWVTRTQWELNTLTKEEILGKPVDSPMLKDCKIFETKSESVPSLLSFLIAGAQKIGPAEQWSVDQVAMENLEIFDSERKIQTVAVPSNEKWAIQVFSQKAHQSEWQKHFCAQLQPSKLNFSRQVMAMLFAKAETEAHLPVEFQYRSAQGEVKHQKPVELQSAWLGPDCMLFEFERFANSTEGISSLSRFFAESADYLFTLLSQSLWSEPNQVRPVQITGLEKFVFSPQLPAHFWVKVEHSGRDLSGEPTTLEISFLSENGAVFAVIEKLALALEPSVQVKTLETDQEVGSQSRLYEELRGLAPADRVSALADFLTATAAKVMNWEGEPGQLKHRDLLKSGMDSILGMKFFKQLQSALGQKVALPAKIVFQTRVPQILAEEIIQNHFDSNLLNETQAQEVSQGSWFYIPKPNPEAGLRLFAFHYAGGAGNLFEEWPQHFGKEVEICAVQLPGRWERASEPFANNFRQTAEAIADSISQKSDLPFAFFGHSMGALLAYEVARILRSKGQQLPTLLVASASRAPHLPAAHQPLSLLTTEEFFQAADRLGMMDELNLNPRVLHAVLPILRADISLYETFEYEEDSPLPVPILALYGEKDSAIPKSMVEAWKKTTSDSFYLESVNGSHLFVRSMERATVEIVSKYLTALRNAQTIGKSA